MSKRMWLRAASLGIVLLWASPGRAGLSGTFTVNGTDGNGNPVSVDCGTLSVTKGPTGRQWHLDGACDRLMQALMTPATPVATQTPIPTKTPGQTQGNCTGTFDQFSSNLWTETNVTAVEGQTLTFCVNLPASATGRPYFEIYTLNLGNSDCGSLQLTGISPSQLRYSTVSPTPELIPAVEAGPWQFQAYLEPGTGGSGCNRFSFYIQYF